MNDLTITDKQTTGISLRLKVIILLADFFLFFGVVSLSYELLISILEVDRYHPWLFRLFMYLIYYTLSELFFNRTLGMTLFGVSLSDRENGEMDKSFFKYSLIVFVDRVLLTVVYMFGVLFRSDKKLLMSEKYSGIRWVKKS